MNLCRLNLLARASVFGLLALGFVTGCAEAVGTGLPVKIPTVVVDCTTNQCKSSSSPYVFVWITKTTCNWQLIDNAVAVVSTTAACNPTSGCRVTMPSNWVLGSNHQSSTTVPSDSYTVCGRINNNRTLPHSVSTNDVTAEIGSLSIVESTGVVSLGGPGSLTSWSDQ